MPVRLHRINDLDNGDDRGTGGYRGGVSTNEAVQTVAASTATAAPTSTAAPTRRWLRWVLFGTTITIALALLFGLPWWTLVVGYTSWPVPVVIAGSVAFATLGGVAYAENPMVGGAPMYANKNIVENAVNSKDHTTLVAAVKAAGLVETLEGKGPFTVFAPTNEAFDALPAGTVDTLLKPENKDKLTKILTCHVIAADATSDVVMKMVKDDGGAHKVKTVGGCELTLKADNGKVTVSDENGNTANVTIADVKQSNGVIHVIDKVLLPKS